MVGNITYVVALASQVLVRWIKRFQVVYCCWLVFELVFVYLYIVETKGLTLEETANLFVGKEVLERIERDSGADVHAVIYVREDEKSSNCPSAT